VIVSVDQFNQGPSGLVIVVPITSKDKNIRSQVAIEAGEGGLKARSFAMCEAVRSISLERMTRRRGVVSPETMEKVAYCLQVLLGI
jgi:mRNA interferase MazF